MINPYRDLHREFTEAGAKLLLSSGQACVMYGIAAFSKDGDWIIEESEDSCRAVLAVLERKDAEYRLGAPLDVRWLSKGWTSHFEYRSEGLRIRVDFCSRPPRVPEMKNVWDRAVRMHGIDIVDVETLIQIKQTRRVRDYSVIGALAEVAGCKENIPEIALEYLQDYDLLKKTVIGWPEKAKQCSREAVKLLAAGKGRTEVITALALEQDGKIQEDEARVRRMDESSRGFQEDFAGLKRTWEKRGRPLSKQHEQLIEIASSLL
jgi:hypothetical protein